MNFVKALSNYSDSSNKFYVAGGDSLRNEAVVESLKGWSENETIDSIKSWFKEEQENCSMSILWVLGYDNYNLLSSHAREKVLKEFDSKVVAKRYIKIC